MADASSTAGLYGRAQELQELRRTLEVLAAGRPAALFLEGEAGIGKTRLLEEAMAGARRLGCTVAAAGAQELEATRPFGVLAEAFGCTRAATDPARQAIARLLSSHPDAAEGRVTVTSDPGLQFRVVDALVDLVETLALQAPLVIGLDDLQWADPSSLLTLGAIGQRLTYLPVAVIGCFRPSPRVPQLQRVLATLAAGDSRVLPLRRLPDEAVVELVADAVAAEPGPGLLRELDAAGGNPLFLIELLGAIQQEGALHLTDERADLTELTVPQSLRDTILRRLAFLPEKTMHSLQIASVLGTSFTLTELSVGTASTVVDLSHSLEEAITSRVLADDGSRLRFRHDLIRDAIYDSLPGSVRLALHREIGQRLGAAGAPAQQVAAHLARGASPGDTAAIGWMRNAAREVSSRSPDIAADLLERALSLMDPLDRSRDDTLAEQARNLMAAGRVSQSESACRALLDRPHAPELEGPLRTCLGQVLLTSGRPAEALGQLELGGADPRLDAAGRASALGWACICHMWLGELDEAIAVAEEGLELGESAGHAMTGAIATAMFGVVAQLRGELPDAVRHIEEAVRRAEKSPGKRAFGYPVHAPEASILIELDRLEDARHALDAGTRISEELGLRWHQPSYSMNRAVERFTAGEWDDAISEAEAGVELSLETGESYSLIISHSVLSWIWLHRNDISRAEAAADAAVGLLAETGARYRAPWAELAQALLLEARGDTSGAFLALAESWDHCGALGQRLEYRVLGPDLIRLAVAAGDSKRAGAVAAEVTRLAAQSPVPSITAVALRCQGLATGDPAQLLASVNAYSASPRRLEAALAHEDAGTALLHRGSAGEARPLLDEALRIFEHLEAQRDLARVEATLRAAGIRRMRKHRRDRPSHGWQSLTPAEQTVAQLVAEGLSNPQIGDRLYVSRRTVQTHLAHVFTKLELTSRSQLAAEVIRRASS